MIGLSSPTADTSGAVLLRQHPGKSKTDEPAARLSRTRCLDATSHIGHSGVVDGDRTFTFVIPNITEAEYAVVKRLHRNYTSVTVACSEGVFTGAIEQPKVSGGTATIKILISGKLSTD